ncbi:acetyl-CoA synthetase-like protein [Hysterangium stoloniferum]|nr:acetyl-CoA synthetase-like protein [Hysterangium stoloniferum]
MAETTYRSHVSLLESAAVSFPSCNVFKLPIYGEGGKIRGWDDVTYKQFYNDVESMAAHWIETLRLPRDSVVALWLNGISYSDIVTFFSISRAGYASQMIRSTLSPALVCEMLAEANASALICDSSSGVSPALFLVPMHYVVDVKGLTDVPNIEILPPLSNTRNADEVMLYYYTSGSTSGRPKLIPYTHKKVHTITMKLAFQTSVGPLRPVTTRFGSLIHLVQLIQFMSYFPNGGCHILAQPDFSSNDLVQMAEQCGLTTLSIYSNQLTKYLKDARNDPRLLSVLRSMFQVSCVAGPVPEHDLDWACSNDLHIVIKFGMSEVGLLLTTTNVRGEKPTGYETLALEGFHHRFVPVEDSYSWSGENLLELVILAESPDCPDVSLCSADGHFHTRDAFIEISPRRYVHRGRLDDRIKLFSGVCDAKTIEEYTNTQCSGVITNCIVVGTWRILPALIVEADLSILDEAQVKAEVAIRIAGLNEMVYPHERIKSTRILVVETGILPRTEKGSIRRSVVEEQFKAHLDKLDD